MSEPIYNPMSLADRMNLRTYLAGKAMAGLLANSSYMECISKASQSNGDKVAAGTAAIAVQNADALIAELNKQTP